MNEGCKAPNCLSVTPGEILALFRIMALLKSTHEITDLVGVLPAKLLEKFLSDSNKFNQT
jgi:hypothetical protein